MNSLNLSLENYTSVTIVKLNLLWHNYIDFGLQICDCGCGDFHRIRKKNPKSPLQIPKYKH